MMTEYDVLGGLQVARGLRSLLRPLIETHTSGTEEEVWSGFARILSDLQPKGSARQHQREAVHHRMELLLQSNPQALRDPHAPTKDVDPEITQPAAPPVVPISDSRLALNALNARWRSLFDVLYDTDVIAGRPSARQRLEHDPNQHQEGLGFIWSFLDQTIPLSSGSHRTVTRYFVDRSPSSDRLSIRADLDDGRQANLAELAQFRGFLGHLPSPTTLLFQHDGLHVEVQLDRDHPLAPQTRAGARDVLLETTPTVVLDFENSAGADDVEDKLRGYRHWAGLIDGSLEIEFQQEGQTVFRRPRQDRYYLGTDGDSLVLKGRSLMLVRTAGLYRQTCCVRDHVGCDVHEGILDAFVATVCALPDLHQDDSLSNSAFGRMYLVKTEPEEVSLTCDLLERVERLLCLEPNSIRLGVMDEDQAQRTRLSDLAAATAAVRFFTPSLE